MKILVVEDDETTAAALAQVLTAHNYIVDAVSDGETGLHLAQSFEYDLIVLDIMLPKLDGINLCRQLRSQGYQMPILLLSAKNSSIDKVMGFNAGADDYIVKPFNLSELIAHIRALLRRQNPNVTPVLTWGDLKLETTNRTVTYQGELLPLTVKEYQLLKLFLQNPQRIFSRNAIIEHLWASHDYPQEDTVTSHVKGLRQKIKAAGARVNLIETVYGLGYRLKSLPNYKKSQQTLNPETEAKVAASLAKLWEKYKDSFYDEVAVLKEVTISLQAGILEPELQQKAAQEAHKLAGILGSFGFLEGSKLAKEIEQLLELPDLEHRQLTQLSQLIWLLQQELNKPPSIIASVDEVQRSLILIINDDEALSEEMQSEATAWGFEVEVATNLRAAKQSIACHPPKVILLDLIVANSTETRLSFLEQMKKEHPQIPVIVFSADNNLTHRLEVARLRGDAFLDKSMSCTEILKAVTQLLNHNQKTQARVMVVDDDTRVLGIVSNLLESRGLHVTKLDDAQKFWQVLQASTPDLLILDINMPDINGIELCQIVRNDLSWRHLPILFLSVYTDSETINQAFTVGADDYLCKPIVKPQLICRVLNRLERARKQSHSLHS
jgi:DNA-binding response OmpR family regulator